MTRSSAGSKRSTPPTSLALRCRWLFSWVSTLVLMKYAMFAGVLASLSAALCFHVGSGPRWAICQTPLPLQRARSVWLHRSNFLCKSLQSASNSLLYYSIGHLSQSGSDPSIVHPVRISADGEFVSHSVSHHFKTGRSRRALRSLSPEGQVYYKLNYNGRALMFNLTKNHHLLSTEYVLERSRAESVLSEGNSCHLLGTVEAPDVKGTAAISTCKGLVGSPFILLTI